MGTEVVITLDCDGTVWLGNPPGPVTLDLIRKWVGKGYKVIMISDSINCQSITQYGVPRNPKPWGKRHEAINELMRENPNAVVYYIDDDQTRKTICNEVADPSRCRFITPHDASSYQFP